MKTRSLFLVLLPLLLIACSGPAPTPETSTPAPTETPAPTPEPPDSLPGFTLRALESLSTQIDVAPGEIELLRADERSFDSACLGLPEPDEVCAQVVTPGYRLVFSTPQGFYIFHTDESGDQFRMAPVSLPVPPQLMDVTAIVWERSGGIAGICTRLLIDFNGRYILQNCARNLPLGSGTLPDDDVEMINDLLRTYRAHDWQFQPPEGSADMFLDKYIFNGSGQTVPSEAQKEKINQILQKLFDRLLNEET